MSRTLAQIVGSLPARQQAKIRTRTEKLISLETIRRGAELTQAALAKRLGIGQDAVSRIERQPDMLVSTLRRYVESAGGELELVVRFPGKRAPVRIEPLHAKRKPVSRRVAA